MVNPSNEFFADVKELEEVDLKLISKKIEMPADKKPDFKKYAKA